MSGVSMSGERLLSSPITGNARCCALAANGNAAAAPPSSEMNWRRLTSSMGSPLREVRSVAATVTGGRCVAAREAYSLRLRCNHRRGGPIFRKDLHHQYAKRQVCLIPRGMCEVPGLKKVLTSFINRLLTSLSECKFAGNHISNSGPNVVMDSDVAVWGKREFGGAQFELTVKLTQVAEDNLLDFDLRRDASCLHGFLSRQAVCSAEQRHQQQ